MQRALSALRSLQEVDRDLYRVRAELVRLPAERDRAESKLRNIQEKIAVLAARIHELRVAIKEIDDDTTMQRQRMRKVEGEAMKARGDVALQAAFQHEARSLKRDISSAEEEGLKLLEEAETLEAKKRVLEQELAAEQESAAELCSNIAKEIEDAEGRKQTLETSRAERMDKDLNPEVVLQYDRILEVRDGQALALLDGKICQGCYMEVPPNMYVRVARGTELVQCPNCQRFLYLMG